MLRRFAVSLVVGCALCSACTVADGEEPSGAPSASRPPSGMPSPGGSGGEPSPDKDERPTRFEAHRAFATVRYLAGRIGPRETTSGAFSRAANAVDGLLVRLGYEVSRQHFRVPAGISWGVSVPSGRTSNVVAAPISFDPTKPHVIVGAHLDTVPQAPGAEDNASGIGVLLELARVAASQPPQPPVVFVAFGAEEPRGAGDAWHHFGSRAYVSDMTKTERRQLVAMVSLDRVGVGAVVPICDGGLGGDEVVRDLRAAARKARVPTSSCGINQSSDHWSFEKAGLPAARLGSTAYDAYHRADDVPSVVSRQQLQRTGDLAWAYLMSGEHT